MKSAFQLLRQHGMHHATDLARVTRVSGQAHREVTASGGQNTRKADLVAGVLGEAKASGRGTAYRLEGRAKPRPFDPSLNIEKGFDMTTLTLSKVRRMLDQSGLKLVKCQNRNPDSVEHGLFQVVDCSTGFPVGPTYPFMYCLTLEDAAEYAAA